MSASLDSFVTSAGFLWLQVALAVWLYVRRIPVLRLPWILMRRCFWWQPIRARARFMTCFLDVSYDITPLIGSSFTFGKVSDLQVADQTGVCSTRYVRSGNGYAAVCSYEKQECTFLLDRGVMTRNFFHAVNLINQGYVLCASMRSLFPGVYLCSHVDAFTFLAEVCKSGYCCFYQKEVDMIIDWEPLSMETPTYAKVFDMLPFIAQAKGYPVLSAVLSALSLLGSFFTTVPWIVLNSCLQVAKNGFQWTMGLSEKTNRVLHQLSTLVPALRPLNTVTNKVSFVKFGVTHMKGGQVLSEGYSLVLSETEPPLITVEQRLAYDFGIFALEFKVLEIFNRVTAAVDVTFTREDEVHNCEKMHVAVGDLALMDAVLNNWVRCYEIPPVFSHRRVGGLYECAQPTTLFQILGDIVKRRSYHLVNIHDSEVNPFLQ